MAETDDRLRRALRRVEPPEGFAERVTARVPRPIRRRPVAAWRRGAAIAAAVALVVVGAAEERERRRGEQAKEELLQAMRITGGKLAAVQEKVRGTGDQGR